MNKKIAIVGTVGVPANYGGFETLVENLLIYHRSIEESYDITVYCSSKAFDNRKTTYMSAELKYFHINANGMSSIIYDILSICHAIYAGKNTILLLGVSGAIILPFLKLFRGKRWLQILMVSNGNAQSGIYLLGPFSACLSGLQCDFLM